MIDPDDRPLESTRLGRAWDHVAAGTAALDPADLALVAPLRALRALDRTPGPDAKFVARLEARLVTGRTAAVPAPTGIGAQSSTLGLNGRGSRPFPGDRLWPLADRRRWPLGQATTAAALILIALAVVLVFRLGGLPPDGGEPTLAAGFQDGDPDFAAALQTPQCDVAPRPRAEFVALLATPRTGADRTPASTAPTAAATPVVIPGDPADTTTIDAVTATVRELTACHNARDPARHYALFTDGALARVFAYLDDFSPQVIIDSIDYLATLATPPPPAPPEATRSLEAVRDVTILPDGRIRAVVDYTSQEGGPFSLVVFFVERDGIYLIDDAIFWTIDPAGAPVPEPWGDATPPATPDAT